MLQRTTRNRSAISLRMELYLNPTKNTIKRMDQIMSYIDDIFERLNLQHIRNFLFYGTECLEISQKDYKQRIEDAAKPAFEMIENKFPDIEEREKVINEVYNYTSTLQDVHMEIGMQCGAILIARLLGLD